MVSSFWSAVVHIYGGPLLNQHEVDFHASFWLVLEAMFPQIVDLALRIHIMIFAVFMEKACLVNAHFCNKGPFIIYQSGGGTGGKISKNSFFIKTPSIKQKNS